jgi:WD40 repeat protein
LETRNGDSSVADAHPHEQPPPDRAVASPAEAAGETGPVAFAADGRTLAITPNGRHVRLIDASTGRTLADLTAPDPLPISCLCFSPDERHLVVAYSTHAIHLWDLHLIREQLAAMGLDWDTP